jgi:hypothetical protein
MCDSLEVRIELIAAYQSYTFERSGFLTMLQKEPHNLIAQAAVKRLTNEITFIEKAFEANGLDIQAESLRYDDLKNARSFNGFQQLKGKIVGK